MNTKRNDIDALAYELYVSSGCIEGRDLDNWLEAERIIAARENLDEEAKYELNQEIAELQDEPVLI